MTDLLNPKIHANGLIDVVAIGVSKVATERILGPFIGNATPKSGILKLAGGGILHGKGKYLDYIAAGLVIDGMEDILQSLILPMVPGAGAQQEQAW